MATISETGHVKNAENFSKLITEVSGFGATYNPSAGDLQIAQLQTKNTAVQTAMANVNTKDGVWKAKINDRQTAYEKMATLASRCVAVAASEDLNAKIIKDLRAVVKKITGRRKEKLPAEPQPAAAPPSAKTISAAQTSFDKRKDHFSKLIGLLQTAGGYTPSEPDLTIAALNTYLGSLSTANTDVNTTSKDLYTSRKLRNIELYKEKTGAVDIALRVKEYVKGMLPAGAGSAEYKRVKAIKFKDLLLTEKESQ